MKYAHSSSSERKMAAADVAEKVVDERRAIAPMMG